MKIKQDLILPAFLFLPALTWVILYNVFNVPLVSTFLWSICINITIILCIFFSVLFLLYLIMRSVFLKKKNPKIISGIAALFMLLLIIADHNNFDLFLWKARLLIYKNHYNSCIQNAINFDKYNSIGYCDFIDQGFGLIKIVYDSSDQFMIPEANTSEGWRIAAVKSGVAGESNYLAIKISKHFYRLYFSRKGEEPDMILHPYFEPSNIQSPLN